MGEADGAAGVADGEHQVGAVDAGDAGRAQPDEGHAVGRGEPGGVEDGTEDRIGAGLVDAVDGGEADVTAAGGAVASHSEDEIAGRREREGGNADAEDVVARRGNRHGAQRRPCAGRGAVCKLFGSHGHCQSS